MKHQDDARHYNGGRRDNFFGDGDHHRNNSSHRRSGADIIENGFQVQRPEEGSNWLAKRVGNMAMNDEAGHRDRGRVNRGHSNANSKTSSRQGSPCRSNYGGEGRDADRKYNRDVPARSSNGDAGDCRNGMSNNAKPAEVTSKWLNKFKSDNNSNHNDRGNNQGNRSERSQYDNDVRNTSAYNRPNNRGNNRDHNNRDNNRGQYNRDSNRDQFNRDNRVNNNRGQYNRDSNRDQYNGGNSNRDQYNGGNNNNRGQYNGGNNNNRGQYNGGNNNMDNNRSSRDTYSGNRNHERSSCAADDDADARSSRSNSQGRSNRQHGNRRLYNNGGDDANGNKHHIFKNDMYLGGDAFRGGGVAKVTYIPPDLDEESLFEEASKPKNFERFAEHKVEASGNNGPKEPYQSFLEAGLPSQVMTNIMRLYYTVPTPIQKWTMPAINMGRDVMACAETGSGKTAAFLLPIISKLISGGLRRDKFAPKPDAIIISPTRELATQTFLEAKKFAHLTDVKCACLYGGVSVEHQNNMMRGAHLLVVTVGRICDFIKRKQLDLSGLKYLVLDEADRMLSDNFYDSIISIVEESGGKMSSKRQTLFFSATFPYLIQKLSYKILNDYIFISVGIQGQANRDIEQVLLRVEFKEKKNLLTKLLQDIGDKKVMVFMNKKKTADALCVSLSEILDTPMTAIHGDLTQSERERVMSLFRSNEASVLMATSVAARGLDIPGVEQIINYDLPQDITEYVHRIGRTARCGNKGKAVSLFSEPDDSPLAKDLLRVLADAEQEVPDWLQEVANRSEGMMPPPHRRDYNRVDARPGNNMRRGGNRGMQADAMLSKMMANHGGRAVDAEEEKDDEWDDD